MATPEDLCALSQNYGVRTPETWKRRLAAQPRPKFIIDEFLPGQSISLLVGDSGLGKSPLLYQAAICVASGIPFLGRQVTKGPVLIMDFENGIRGMNQLVTGICGFLRVPEPPELFLWNANDCAPRWNAPGGYDLSTVVRAVKPVWTIVDSVTRWRSDLDENSTKANQGLTVFRTLVSQIGVTITGVHHPKKQKGDDPRPSLETAGVHEWLQCARGSGALINASDVRLGVDKVASGGITPYGQYRCQKALIVKGFTRLDGEIRPIYLARVLDAEGTPIGYVELNREMCLGNSDQQAAYAALPPVFQTKDAKTAYGREDQATNEFLLKCERMGLLRKRSRGWWEKTGYSGETGECSAVPSQAFSPVNPLSPPEVPVSLEALNDFCGSAAPVNEEKLAARASRLDASVDDP